MLLICFHISNRSSLVLHSRFSLSFSRDSQTAELTLSMVGRMR